jgi:hypothetical protein
VFSEERQPPPLTCSSTYYIMESGSEMFMACIKTTSLRTSSFLGARHLKRVDIDYREEV